MLAIRLKLCVKTRERKGKKIEMICNTYKWENHSHTHNEGKRVKNVLRKIENFSTCS